MQLPNSDNLLRSKLDALHAAPAGMDGDFNGVWDKLEKKLGAPDKRTFTPWFIAAALFAISIIVYVLIPPQASQKQAIVISPPHQNDLPSIEKQRINTEPALAIRGNQQLVTQKNFKSGKAPIKVLSKHKNALDIDKLIVRKTISIETSIQEVLPVTIVEILPATPIVQVAKPKLKILHQNEIMQSSEINDARMRLTKAKEEKQPLKLSTSLFSVWSNKSTSLVTEN